jgi:hypothetical protein
VVCSSWTSESQASLPLRVSGWRAGWVRMLPQEVEGRGGEGTWSQALPMQVSKGRQCESHGT